MSGLNKNKMSFEGVKLAPVSLVVLSSVKKAHEEGIIKGLKVDKGWAGGIYTALVDAVPTPSAIPIGGGIEDQIKQHLSKYKVSEGGYFFTEDEIVQFHKDLKDDTAVQLQQATQTYDYLQGEYARNEAAATILEKKVAEQNAEIERLKTARSALAEQSSGPFVGDDRPNETDKALGIENSELRQKLDNAIKEKEIQDGKLEQLKNKNDKISAELESSFEFIEALGNEVEAEKERHKECQSSLADMREKLGEKVRLYEEEITSNSQMIERLTNIIAKKEQAEKNIKERSDPWSIVETALSFCGVNVRDEKNVPAMLNMLKGWLDAENSKPWDLLSVAALVYCTINIGEHSEHTRLSLSMALFEINECLNDWMFHGEVREESGDFDEHSEPGPEVQTFKFWGGDRNLGFRAGSLI